MSTDKGYIKIFRDVRDHWLWEDKPFSMGQAWFDLLMMVNHEDKIILFDKAPTMVYRGMTITSLRKLSERWGWSRDKVTRFLDNLENERMIRMERAPRKKTTISIVNYGLYQGFANQRKATEKPETGHRPDTDRPKQYTKEYTKENTKEKIGAPAEPVVDDDDDGEDPMEALKRWEAENGNL